MNKTLLLKGLTSPATAAGAAADTVLDITEKVFGVNPSLKAEHSSAEFYNTMHPKYIPEGKFKYELQRKGLVTTHDTTAALHDGTGKLGATIGALSTAGFEVDKADQFDHTLNGS